MKRALQIGFGIAVAVLLMWLLLRGVSFSDLADAMREVQLVWLAAMQVPVWVAFFTRVQRWTYIVRVVHPCSFKNLLIATQLMFLWNFTIGMRLGEFVRPVVLKRLERIPFSKGLALSTLDRVTDLIGLMAIVAVAVIFYHPTQDIHLPSGLFGIENPPTIPKGLIQAGTITAIIGLTGIIALLVTLYLSQSLALRITHAIFGVVSKRLADLVCGMLEQFAEGLHVFRSTADMVKSIAFSLATWALFVASLYCLMMAFDMEFEWYAPFVVQAMLAFFVGAPGTPGMLGQFHLPLVGGLLMVSPETTIPTAVAFAIVAHLVNLIPIFILGVYSFFSLGMGFAEIAHEREEVEEETERE
jgi:glycosyltransferase 2 family protein